MADVGTWFELICGLCLVSFLIPILFGPSAMAYWEIEEYGHSPEHDEPAGNE